MDDLVARLRACLDTDERVALAAGRDQPSWVIEDVPPFTDPLLMSVSGDGETYTTLGTVDVAPEHREHIARNDPERTRRWVKAAREILDLADRADGIDEALDGNARVGPRDYETEPLLGEQIVAALMSVYGDEAG